MSNNWFRLVFVFTTAVVLVLPIGGCGSSQDDLMARAMKRKRPSDDEEDEPPVPAPVVEAAPTASTESGSAESKEPVKLELSIKPIEERKPAKPLSDSERRTRSVDNLKAIYAALDKFVQRNKAFPEQHTKTPGGFKALSWRVSLLPDLGYQDLYAKFDQTKRWDEEPNLSLLQYIPDQFVSPERFDTSTNFLVPVKSNFVFKEKGVTMPRTIEDGLDNVIYLMEVDDKFAVPWTKPADFDPNLSGGKLALVKEGLGGLRGDGTFAIWGSGYPVLLASSLSGESIYQAWTIDGGESGLAAQIHRDIPLSTASEASLTSVETDAALAETSYARPEPVLAVPIEIEINRPALPPAVDISAATQKLNDIYKDRIVELKEDVEKARFASELVRTSLTLESDPPGMYAMQQMALEYGLESTDITPVLDSIDAMVVSFNVDAYTLNRDSLLAYVKTVASSKASASDDLKFTQRAIRTLAAAVNDNDFDSASELSRAVVRVSLAKKTDTLPRLLNELALKLGSAKTNFEVVKKSLTDYREDPENNEAASVVGRYLCFIKGDWDGGLPLLVRGGPESLQDIARIDLEGAADAKAAIELGDAWWELSKAAKIKAYKEGAIDRALIWYQQAYEALPASLDKMHCKARLDEGKESIGSPMALLRRLAEETKVDLRVSLAAVHVNKPGARRGGDNDDDE
jgi:Arc/MetJ-type ribon-helix-helix transcriptional regulator